MGFNSSNMQETGGLLRNLSSNVVIVKDLAAALMLLVQLQILLFVMIWSNRIWKGLLACLLSLVLLTTGPHISSTLLNGLFVIVEGCHGIITHLLHIPHF